MLTEQTISKFYADLKLLGLKQPVAAISKATGYSKGNVSMYLSKKDSPSENFINAFYREFGKSIKKVPHGTQQEDSPGKIVDHVGIKEASPDLSLQAIKNLTESGKELAEAQKIMVINESRLISLLEQKFTADSSKDNGVASPKVMSGILVAMAKIASGTRWHSEQEALRELGRLLSPQADESKIQEGIQVDEGK